MTTVIHHVLCWIIGYLLTEKAVSREICETEACKNTAYRILQYMDPTYKPCENFYRYVCGSFIKTAELHDDKTQNSSFSQVGDRLEEQLKVIVHEPPKSNEPLPYNKMKHLFSLCMDEKKIDGRGVSHAVALLREAGGWPVLGQWSVHNWTFLNTEIRLRQMAIGGGSLFTLSVSVDAKNTSRRVIELTVPREERRNFDRMYNPYTLRTLMASELGWIRWDELLQSIVPSDVFISRDEHIVISEVDYFRKLRLFLQKHSNEVIANHMMWHTASDMSTALTNDMRDRAQQFRRVIVGTTAREPRWKECVAVASSLALALSSIYVRKYFDETSKKEALEMTENIRQEMSKDLLEVGWMDDKTREHAKHKVSRVVQHIGYPDELTNNQKIEQHYSGLELDKEHYLEAIVDLAKWAVARRFRRLREPVNKTDWRNHGDVAQVNAFYNPVENSMQFPAGILQQPFFSSQVPKYVNYGTIGYIIAHEITHGFDDQGSQFDSDGELKDWWEEESKKRFEEKKKCFIDQYGSFYEPQANLTINGINTQGENVADVAGLKLSYRAYQRLSLREPTLPGLTQFTEDQMLMISMANMWCTRYRPEALHYQITAGVHCPAEFRVNGAVMNLPQFGKLFHCKPLEPMNPPDKCAVW